jgi:CelD/BcsL family acetyltransferase involved in cellulose biosynthesis
LVLHNALPFIGLLLREPPKHLDSDAIPPLLWRRAPADATPLAAGSALRVERLSGPAAFDALSGQWEKLSAAQSLRTPFSTPLWNRLWWAHLREQRRFLRDEFHAFAVYDASGALVAVAPMMLTHRPGSGPLRMRKLQFFGADPFITEMRGLVARPEDRAAATAVLLDHLRERHRDWDWTEWFGQPGDMPAAETGGTAALRRTREIPDYYIRLPESWEQFKGNLPPNTKEALRKCYKALAREDHRHALRVVERPGEVPSAMERFYALHTDRANQPSGEKHRDVFGQPPARAFLSAYAGEMAARGQLRIFELIVDGQVVASRLAFRFDGELYLYYSGFNTAWAKYNVMTTLMAEIIKWSIAQGIAILNLSTGTDRSKSRWRPECRTIWAATMTSPAPRGKLGHFAYERVLTGALANATPSWMLDRLKR